MRPGRFMPTLFSAAAASWIIALALLASPRPASAAPQPGAGPMANPVAAQGGAGVRVAVANPSVIFNKMQETAGLKDRLEQRRKELYGQEMQKRQVIKALEDQRADTLSTNPLYRELSEKIDSAKADLQSWATVTRLAAERDQKQMVKTLYDKIEVAIGEVAQQEGIDLVLIDGRQEITNLEEIPFEEFRRVLNSRNVLYANKRVDITDKVLLAADAKFAKGGK